jgi:uncharacterized membrane protein YagU involved in acid resistance
MSRARAILTGAAVVGALDALDAIIFFGLRSGVTPGRIFQSVASGLLGRASFQGGAATVALGVLIHFSIAFSIVATYYLASRRFDLLTRRAVVCGIAYGVVVYLFMNLVVVPLSAVTRGHPALPVIVNGVLIHMFGVGLPSAVFARAASVAPRVG